MRASIDTTKCLANGLCESLAPGVFAVDEEDGLAHVLVDDLAPAHVAGATQSAKLCPTGAINLEES